MNRINDMKGMYGSRVWKRWAGMFRRVYEPNNRPTYLGCEVDPAWQKLSDFNKWVEDQPAGALINDRLIHLDKDILKEGNKVYGPDFCCLVPHYVNSAIVGVNKPALNYRPHHTPKKPYGVLISIDNHLKWLGSYETEIEAVNAWRQAKAAQILDIKTRYMREPCIDWRVVSALTDRALDLVDLILESKS